MVQLNPIPVFGAKKTTSTIWWKIFTKFPYKWWVLQDNPHHFLFSPFKEVLIFLLFWLLVQVAWTFKLMFKVCRYKHYLRYWWQVLAAYFEFWNWDQNFLRSHYMLRCQGSKFSGSQQTIWQLEIDTRFVQFLGKHNSRTILGLFHVKLQFSRPKICSITRLSLTLALWRSHSWFLLLLPWV